MRSTAGRLRVVACLMAALVVAPACAPRLADPLAQPSVIDARDRRVRALQADLAAILAAPVVAHGLVAMGVIRSTATPCCSATMPTGS